MQRKCLQVLLFVTLCAGMAWAQFDRGEIRGIVTDKTGAVVPNAEISVINNDTRAEYRAKSDGLGLYSVLNLPIGTYSMTFEAAGFQKQTIEAVTLTVAQVASINPVLQIGSVTQSVQVTTASPILETDTHSVDTVMENEAINELPITADGGRSIEGFAFATMPGVTGDWWTSHISGSPAFQKQVLIDGVSAEAGVPGDVGEMSPSMESVQEFRVDTADLRADAARGAGAMTFSLKSGTNTFHGSAFDILANEFLNANTWDNKAGGVSRPRARYDDYGFSAGGPIIKNKTFAFGAAEFYDENNLTTSDITTVPTTGMLQGNFSQLLDTTTVFGTDPCGNKIYKGAIFDTTTTSATYGCVFSGNMIPAYRISALSQKIISIYQKDYAPVNSGLVNNAPMLTTGVVDSSTVSPKFNQHQYTFKVDHNFSGNDHVSAAYIRTYRPRYQITTNGVYETGTDSGGPLANARIQGVTTHQLRVQETHTFRPTLINVLSAAYNDFNQDNVATSGTLGTNWNQTLGLPSSLDNFPVLSFGGVNGINEGGVGRTDSGGYNASQYIYNDLATWVKGRLTTKFGAEYRALQMNGNWYGNGGTYSFSFANTQGLPSKAYLPTADQNYVGFGFANFVLGNVHGASETEAQALYGRRKEMSLFVTNDFRVNNRLTVTADLRWELNSRFKERYGHLVEFDPTLKDTADYGTFSGALAYGANGGSSFETNQYYGNLGPHVGAAYELSQKLVLRGGYGLTYIGLGNEYWEGTPYGYAPGFVGINQVVATSTTATMFDWDNGYPGVAVYSKPVPPNITWGPVTYDADSLKLGFTQNWNAGVQYQLNKDTVLDLSYVANKGSRIHDGSLDARNYPQLSAYQALVASGNDNNWICSASDAASAGVPYFPDVCDAPNWGTSAYNLIQPYPQVAWNWSPVYFLNSPVGSTGYNAMVINLKKQGANGLTVNLNYTLSKATGNTSQNFVESYASPAIQDITKLAQEAKVVQPYDQKNVVKGYFDYKLPFGEGKMLLNTDNHAMNAIVGGWTLAALFQYQSGMPLGAPTATNSQPGWPIIYANIASGANFSNTFKHPNLFGSTPDSGANFFNPASFTNPTVNTGQLGNAPRYLANLRGWGYYDEDASLMKSGGFGPDNRVRVTFRAEFFNIFNRHQWGSPNMNLSSPLFGEVQSVSGNRTGQLGLRAEW